MLSLRLLGTATATCCLVVVLLAATVPPADSFGVVPRPLAASATRGRITISVGRSPALELAAAGKKQNGGGSSDDGDRGKPPSRSYPREQDVPGLIFFSVLTLWHFWIGPALRPIILDLRQ